jgi:excisionase family DNA binding protein
MELPNIITPKELMAYLRCSKTTAYDLCRRKDFPSFRIGKAYYIQADKLEAWFDKESAKPKY